MKEACKKRKLKEFRKIKSKPSDIYICGFYDQSCVTSTFHGTKTAGKWVCILLSVVTFLCF